MPYTLWPTFAVGVQPERDDDSDPWITDDRDPEHGVIEACRSIGADGAHCFSGSHGPEYGEDGYELNYCGWIDARTHGEPA